VDGIKQAFDAYFASYGLSLPPECLARRAGGFEEGGWEIAYRLGAEHGVDFLELFASHRLTNDRLYRVYDDGRVELVDSATDGLDREHDRQFYSEVRRRGFGAVGST
jgi:hypothetical protein